MAFGISRTELLEWKRRVSQGEIAFITHYWLHPRFPQIKTVTKVGCADINKLIAWALANELKPEWIHNRERYPHFDLIGPRQIEILSKYKQYDQLKRFDLQK